MDRSRFFAAHRAAFGALKKDSTVAAIEALIGFIEADAAWPDARHIAYFLATTKHETAHTFEPIEEFADGWDYDPSVNPRKAERLGNTEPGDGPRYKGRGFVQLTGRSNYQRFERLLDKPLVAHPEIACDAPVAYAIAALGMRDGLFTGASLKKYINAERCDYIGARRIINGLDRAERIAGYARQYESILRESAKEETT